MGSLLIDEWLGESERLGVLDAASVSIVRERVRSEGATIGLPATITAKLVNVASELAHNQIAHARAGQIVVRRVERGGVPGLEVVAADQGEGLSDPTRALNAAPRVPEASEEKKSLGIGLAAARELADEIDVDVRLGEGTCIWARKFAGEVPRRRQVGIYGRMHPDERVSGDHGTFVRTDADLLVALADGLGHGPEAHEASIRAIATVRAARSLALDRIVDETHKAIAPTRGAVMGLARIAEPEGTIHTVSVGNVTIHVYGPGTSWGNAGTSFVLGAPGRFRRPTIASRELQARDVLVLYTDGLTSRTSLEGKLELLHEHPIVIAHHLAREFGRDNDDLLVVVAK
jgi:anti-sigma regulatory factor (Ser/Thr protein kinase)